MNKFIMAGIITITLPFGGGFVISSSAPTAVNSVVGSNTSYNWSGYQATGGTFTAVSGTWTIPNVADATSTEADATWVGIGGVANKDLIQVGTQAVINGSGAPAYQAWYEILPAATTQVSLTVSPGDSISASLTQTSAASGSSEAEWSVSIRDNTTGQSYQTSVAYNSSLSSAEWIEEMPSDGSSFVPLDNFGTVSFSGGTTTVNGVAQTTMTGANAQELTMVNNADQTLASPSVIGADGESFMVTRTSATAEATTIGRSGLGRGWRRTGVGIKGFTPRPSSTSTAPGSTSVSGTSGSLGASSGGFAFSGGNPWNQFYRIMQQFQQLRGSYNGYLHNGFKFGQ